MILINGALHTISIFRPSKKAVCIGPSQGPRSPTLRYCNNYRFQLRHRHQEVATTITKWSDMPMCMQQSLSNHYFSKMLRTSDYLSKSWSNTVQLYRRGAIITNNTWCLTNFHNSPQRPPHQISKDQLCSYVHKDSLKPIWKGETRL